MPARSLCALLLVAGCGTSARPPGADSGAPRDSGVDAEAAGGQDAAPLRDSAPPPPDSSQPPEGSIEDPCLVLEPTIEGTDGDDVLSGTAGRDVIFGHAGNDVIDAGGGDDVVCAGFGRDTVRGGEGDDYLDGGFGQDELHGGPGSDTIHGRSTGDFIYGEDGDDFLFGDILDDRLWGGEGDDLLVGGHGVDMMDGGPGSDWLRGDTNGDDFYGGTGFDTASFATAAPPGQPSPDGVAVAFSGGVGSASGDGASEPLVDIENVVGSPFDDRLDLAAPIERAAGNYGDDEITAPAGAEIAGGPGADTCNGAPCDEADEPPPRPAIAFAFLDARPRDIGLVVLGSQGDVDDVLRISMAGPDVVRITATDADVEPGPGCARPGGAGVVECQVPGTLRYVLAYGDGGDDTIEMGNGFARDMTAHLYGGPGDDTLLGGDGEDVLFTGQTGLDRLEGREGDDALISEVEDRGAREGQVHPDTLLAGPGNDQLVTEYPCGGHSFSGGDGWDVAGFARSSGYRNAIHAQLGGAAQNEQEFHGRAFAPAICAAEGGTTLAGDLEVLEGADGDDWLVGDDSNNIIWGRDGDDTIQGLGGDDVLEGLSDDDTIYGGPGRDRLRGGSGWDELYAGDGEADFVIDCEGNGGCVGSRDGADPEAQGCGSCP
ncbi:MAG: hypothetical protein HYY06_09350 [Deltaproteobacteria bacterium]|nr:hypothetical protein [Deltaproteobacteria bacterium]